MIAIRFPMERPEDDDGFLRRMREVQQITRLTDWLMRRQIKQTEEQTRRVRATLLDEYFAVLEDEDGQPR